MCGSNGCVQEELEKRERVQSREAQLENQAKQLRAQVNELQAALVASEVAQQIGVESEELRQKKLEAVCATLNTVDRDEDSFVRIFSAVESLKATNAALETLTIKLTAEIDIKTTAVMEIEVRYKLTVDELNLKLSESQNLIRTLQSEVVQTEQAQKSATSLMASQCKQKLDSMAAEHAEQVTLKDQALVEIAAEKLQLDQVVAASEASLNAQTAEVKQQQQTLEQQTGQMAEAEKYLSALAAEKTSLSLEVKSQQEALTLKAAEAELQVQTLAEAKAKNSWFETQVDSRDKQLKQQNLEAEQSIQALAELAGEKLQLEQNQIEQQSALQEGAAQLLLKEGALTDMLAEKMRFQQESSEKEEVLLAENQQTARALADLTVHKIRLEEEVEKTAAEASLQEQALTGAMTKNSWFQQEVSAVEEALQQKTVEAKAKEDAIKQMEEEQVRMATAAADEKMRLAREAGQKEEALQLQATEAQQRLFLMLQEMGKEKQRLETEAAARQLELVEQKAVTLQKDETLAEMAAKRTKLEHQLASKTDELEVALNAVKMNEIVLQEAAADKVKLEQDIAAKEVAHAGDLLLKDQAFTAMTAEESKRHDEDSVKAKALKVQMTAETAQLKATFETELAAKDELLKQKTAAYDAKEQALVKAHCAAAYTAAQKADCDVRLEEMGKEKERLETEAAAKQLQLVEQKAVTLQKDETLAETAAKRTKLEHQLASKTDELEIALNAVKMNEIALQQTAADKVKLEVSICSHLLLSITVSGSYRITARPDCCQAESSRCSHCRES